MEFLLMVWISYNLLLFKSCHFTTLCLRKTDESTVNRLFYIYTAILPEIDMSSRHASNFWSSSLYATIKPIRLLLWLSSHTQHWLVCVDDWLFSFCKFPPQFVNILLYILLHAWQRVLSVSVQSTRKKTTALNSINW